MSRKKATHLYVLSCGTKLKIGVTSDIQARVKTLQTGNADEIKIEYLEERNEPYKIETWLKQQLGSYRVRGEWYEGIDVRDVRVKILTCYHLD